MSFLAFTGNLKARNATTTESRMERLSSSEEYEVICHELIEFKVFSK